jgi:hypothetical protein
MALVTNRDEKSRTMTSGIQISGSDAQPSVGGANLKALGFSILYFNFVYLGKIIFNGYQSAAPVPVPKPKVKLTANDHKSPQFLVADLICPQLR